MNNTESVMVDIFTNDGEIGSPRTSMRTVFDDEGKSLHQYIEESIAYNWRRLKYEDYFFIIRSQSDFDEWAFNQKNGVRYTRVLLLPGTYDAHGTGINLSKLKTKFVCGIIGQDGAPKIVFKNSTRGFYYEDTDHDMNPLTVPDSFNSNKKRSVSIQFGMKDIEVVMEYEAYNGGEECIALSNISNLNNTAVIITTEGNTEPFSMLGFDGCMGYTASIYIEDRNPDIRPTNSYRVMRDCKELNVKSDNYIMNGFSRVKYD